MPRVKVCVKAGDCQVALEERELPDPAPGQALIRTTTTTICGSDLHMVDHIPSIPAGMPQGHEAVGIVEAVGEGVERFRPGDRVVSSCTIGCGGCALCKLGDRQLCQTYGAPFNVLFGCQAEAYLVGSADLNLASIPESMDDRAALLTSDIMSTGFAAIERGRLQPGQTVAIFAQGPVGLCVTAAAKHHGAGRIIAVEGVPERAAMARRLGADDVIAPDQAAERIRELTGGLGVDLAVEALGRPETFQACLASIRIGGTVSVVGVFADVEALSLPMNATFFQQTVVTSYCPNGTARLEYLMGLLERGDVDLAPLFTHEAELASIADSYDRFRHREDGVLKIAIRP